MSSQPRWSPIRQARSLCVGSAVSVALCWALTAAQAQQPPPGSVSALSSQSPEDLARGKRMFEAQCSARSSGRRWGLGASGWCDGADGAN